MKLEYLDDISDGGKYKDVVSENLVRLYDFGQKETTELVNLIYQRLIHDKKILNLTTTDFIQSVNCHMTLQLSLSDEGVIITNEPNFFICKLTEQTYMSAIEKMKSAADSGYNWLCDTSKKTILTFCIHQVEHGKTKGMPLTLGFMQVGLEIVTSIICKSKLWFGAGQATLSFCT